MNDFSWTSIIWLVACLLIWGSAMASFKLDWGKSIKLALIWLGIFAGLFLIADLVGARLPN